MLIVDALDASHHDAAQPTDVEHEIATYLDLPPIPRTSCPGAWWRDNESRFPALPVSLVVTWAHRVPQLKVRGCLVQQVTSSLISATVWQLNEQK